ncbi:MAG: pyridoxamine 5'-phosphate oxidase family protein [Motilibacteraceae bacterium]
MEPPLTSADQPSRADRTRVRRLPDKQRSAREDLDAVLDAGRVAHLGLVDSGQPFVLPVGYARVGDDVLMHGSTGSRLFRALAAGAPCCLTVTVLDGWVLARSSFESSMHYRSAMVLGTASPLEGAAKLDGLRAMSERWLPGRWDKARRPNAKELAATLVLSLPLLEWSVKVSDAPPEDDPADLDLPVWAGTVPIREVWGKPVPAPDLRAPLPVPDYLRQLVVEHR